MDTELFELCREVYKRTGWQIENPMFFGAQYIGSPYETDVHITSDQSAVFIAPLYTSDYIIEKLPNHCKYGSFALTTFYDDGHNYDAGYIDIGEGGAYWGISTNDNVALKALLKLVVALHEEGELLEKGKV